VKTKSKSRVCLIGMFPPPLHGMSLINDYVRNQILMSSEPLVIDYSPSSLDRGFLVRFGKAIRVGRCVLKLICCLVQGRVGSVYLGLSGGNGQIYDAIFVAICRLFGRKLYLHHHSYQYLDRPRWLSRLLFAVSGKDAVHVVACAKMANDLKRQYPVAHEIRIISGEGGALLINDPLLAERAEIIREKGTNRSKFFRGQVAKYTWVDIGSSYLPGEIIAAFLWAQMEAASEITSRRLKIWQRYHAAFDQLEQQGRVRRPHIPSECEQNAHMYYLLLNDLEDRSIFISFMKQHSVSCVFHYVPLHSAPQGESSGRPASELLFTQELSDRLVRLPLWVGLEEGQQAVIDKSIEYLMGGAGC